MSKIITVICMLNVLNTACRTLHNRINNTALECGADYKGSSQYLIVRSPDGERLMKNELDFLPLDEVSNSRPLQTSSKGCVEKPSSGRYLVKSLKADWAAIVDPNMPSDGTTIQLEKNKDSFIQVKCRENETISVNDDFTFESLISNDASSTLKAGLVVEYKLIQKSTSQIKRAESSPLERIKNIKNPFQKNDEEGSYEIHINFKNIVKNSTTSDKVCQLILDRTPPNVKFTINQKFDYPLEEINRIKKIAIVDATSNIGLSSEGKDTKMVEYCLIPMEDRSEIFTLETFRNWKDWSENVFCPHETLIQAEANQPIFVPKRSGFQSIRFRAIDNLGNASAWQNQPMLFYKKESISLGESYSRALTKSLLESKQDFEALNIVLLATSIFEELSTQYEKRKFVSDLQSSLMRIENMDLTEIIPIIDFGSPSMISISQNGRSAFTDAAGSGYSIWNVREKKIVATRKPITFNAVKDFAINREGTIGYVAFSSGLQKIDMLNGNVLREAKEAVGIETIVLTEDQKSLIVASSKTIKLYDAQSMELKKALEYKTSASSTIPSPSSLTLSEDGNFAALNIGNPREILVFDISSFSIHQHLNDLNYDIGRIKFTGNSSTILFETSERKVMMWNLSTKEVSSVIELPFFSATSNDARSDIYAIDFSKSGKTILWIDRENFLNLTDAEAGTLARRIKLPFDGVSQIRVYGDDQTLFITDGFGRNHLMRLADTLDTRFLKLPAEFAGLAFRSSIDSHEKMRGIDTKGFAFEWDMNTNSTKSFPINNREEFLTFEMTNNGDNYIGKRKDATTELYDFSTQTRLGRIDNPLPLGSFSDDGRYFVDPYVRIFDLIEGKEDSPINLEPSFRIASTCFSQFSHPMLIQTDSQYNYLVDLQNGKILLQFEANVGDIHSIHFYTLKCKGNYFLSQGFSDPFQLFTFDREINSYFLNDTRSGEFMPDGHHFLTVQKDDSVAMWEAASGTKMNEIISNTSDFKTQKIFFSKTKPKAYIISKDNRLKVMDLDIGEIKKKLCKRFLDIAEPKLCEPLSTAQ